MAKVIRCGECNCYHAICLAAETARDCRGCSQAANISAECCCWQAAHGGSRERSESEPRSAPCSRLYVNHDRM